MPGKGVTNMDKVTYMAVNGLSEAEYNAIAEAMREAPGTEVSPKVLAILEALINRGPRDGRLARVGAARTIPLAYTHR